MNGMEGQLILSQRPSLTPGLIQDLKILQMSRLELEQFIEEEMIDNPLLEMDEDQQAQNGEEERSGGTDESEEPENDTDNLEFTCFKSQPVTLRQYLLSQLGEIKVSNYIKKIAIYLIECIDDDGYLCEGIHDIAKKLTVPYKEVLHALRLIQQFEPEGVGARCLQESLIIQASRHGWLDEKFKTVVKGFLKNLAYRNYNEISLKTGIRKDDVARIHELIKHLDPKPGYAISSDRHNYCIVPEIEARLIDDKVYIVLCNERQNRIKVSEYYQNLVSKDAPKDINQFVKEKLSRANNLLKAIEQRQNTILAVAAFIMDYQKDFLKRGYPALKPLTLKMAAIGVGCHESTVSRTVNGKYIQTPRGIFELKHFFSAQSDSVNNAFQSAIAIKRLIFGMIKSEDKSKPLSDTQIKDDLESEGIKIARRTIAKYREALSILPAAQRRFVKMKE